MSIIQTTPRCVYLAAVGLLDEMHGIRPGMEHAPLLQDTSVFLGKELEGPLCGTPTLFVQGRVEFNRIKDVLASLDLSEQPPKHVYFGAGMLSEYDVSAVQKVIDTYPDLEVTIESTQHNVIESVGQNRKFNWMLTLMMAGVPTGAQNVLSNALVYLEGRVRKQRIFMKTDTGRHVIVTELKTPSMDVQPWRMDGFTTVNTFEEYTKDIQLGS